MKKFENHSWDTEDELGRVIGKIPYPEPAGDLVRSIMATLKPIQPSLRQRLLTWLTEPMTLRISPALAAIAMILVMLPGGYAVYYLHGNPVSEKNIATQAGVTPVVFNYKSEDVNSVAIMGSFNDWDPKGHELAWQPEAGHWSLQLNLPPGKHDYVFVVNGEKVYQDPEADLIQQDDFGNRNSVRFVKGHNGIQI